MKIDAPGTRDQLLKAIAAVGEKLGPNDNLLLHTSNHGNTYGGEYYIVSSDVEGPDTASTDLAGALNALPRFSSLMVMMQQCFSGGFIQPILDASPAECTSVATAVPADETSDGGEPFDPFACYWISAMANADPYGSPVDADANGDGEVSAIEAFNYAKANDLGGGDCPQFGQNDPCGGSCTLALHRRIVVIPSIYRYLFPWQILPDPSPKQVQQLAGRIGALLQSQKFRSALAASVKEGSGRLEDVVRAALT
jgi:hypothetical protein